MRCVSRLNLVRTTSFRLAALYLLLFTLSALALGAFVYLSVRHEILADFDERIVEETDSLQRIFAMQGKERLSEILEARGSSGGALTYGLLGPDGKQLAGSLDAPALGAGALHAGWSVLNEAEDNEAPEDKAEVLRALVTPLADGSILIVGDERRRADQALSGILSAFAWAVGATILLGIAGGLWLSAQFLRRVDAMRLAAHGIMAGDWSRRIPLTPVNDDLSALARTFNRLFERIEKLLLANRHVSADIAHDLRKPLAHILRRLEEARAGDASPAAIRSALDASIVEIEGVLETFEALLRIGQIEAGARRAAFKPLDLAEIARDVVEAFQPAADEGGRTLACRLETPLPMSGDRELMTQMVANLLDNALRHTPEGVRILVAGERSAHGVTLTVEDNGPGVAAQDLSAIFQRFYRADAARSSPGSGLGLSLVAAIAELHGLECSASDNHPGLKITLATADPDE
jgi:signal transduction histidine kinase